MPWIQRDLAPGGVEGIVYYGGSARIGSVLELVRASTGIGAWYPGPLDDLAAAKRVVGDRGVCAGVINDIPLIDDTPGAIREEVRRILAAGMPGGHFMFGTVLMPYAIPEANVRAMLEAAFELGRSTPP
jgi:uroporphyrinogen decarboxylase